MLAYVIFFYYLCSVFNFNSYETVFSLDFCVCARVRRAGT